MNNSKMKDFDLKSVGKDKRLRFLFLGVIILLLLVVVFLVNRSVKSKFASGTMVNEIDLSGMTLDEAKEAFENYTIRIVERNAVGQKIDEKLSGKTYGMKVTSTAGLERILKDQSIFQYLFGKGKETKIADCFEFDSKKLKEEVAKLRCFDANFIASPREAKLSNYQYDEGYTIIKGTRGNIIDQEKAEYAILNCIYNMKKEVDLDVEDCYEELVGSIDGREYKKACDTMNKYTGVTIDYQFGDAKLTIEGGHIAQWIHIDQKTGEVVFREDKVSSFIASLHRRYDTVGTSRNFENSYGETIRVSGGNYGWLIDNETETQGLIQQIKSGKSGKRTPVYKQDAVAYGDADYGNSYLEVNLTEQHLFLYINGQKMLESDCVTGNRSVGNGTPTGTYYIASKNRNMIPSSENYTTPVQYRMAFYKNVGINDAGWREKFGRKIYLESGSNGSIEVPTKAAKKIYKYMKIGMPVICYR